MADEGLVEENPACGDKPAHTRKRYGVDRRVEDVDESM